jgi:hypothetical protein
MEIIAFGGGSGGVSMASIRRNGSIDILEVISSRFSLAKLCIYAARRIVSFPVAQIARLISSCRPCPSGGAKSR